MQDEYGLESHRRASKAQLTGRFDQEIVPVTYKSVDDETGYTSIVEVAQDDGIRHGLTIDKLAALKSVFKENGGSTAGNS
jgi:acetyl-CoA acyltransferase 1